MERRTRALTPDITTWLEEVQIPDSLEGPREGQKQDESCTKTSDLPYTPNRRPQLEAADSYEKISPTDTNFSGHSIFDTPLHPDNLLVRNGSYAGTVASSLDDDGENERPCVRARLFVPAATDVESPRTALDEKDDDLSRENLCSYGPLSGSEADKEEAPGLLIPITSLPTRPLSTEPQVVILVSCLQCTLAGLPCSRTHPSCSRCTRNGCGDVCLLLRKRTVPELLHGYHILNGTPMLLKTIGEEEDVWQRKATLFQEKMEQWWTKCDRHNWVHPTLGRKTDAIAAPFMPRFHPGEGTGQHACKMIRLAEYEDLLLKASKGRGKVKVEKKEGRDDMAKDKCLANEDKKCLDDPVCLCKVIHGPQYSIFGVLSLQGLKAEELQPSPLS